jgi:hypothetical protein
VKRTLVFSVVLLVAVFALASSPAKADNIDFSCGSLTCTGTVVGSGANFSSTGIGGLTPGATIASEGADTFTLIFNTSTGLIQIRENGVTDFAGTITNFTSLSSGNLTQLNLSVNWTTIPGDVSGNAGTTPFSSVISITTNGSTYNAWSVDVPITTAVPEPSSFLLLGAGLLLTPFLKLKRRF